MLPRTRERRVGSGLVVTPPVENVGPFRNREAVDGGGSKPPRKRGKAANPLVVTPWRDKKSGRFQKNQTSSGGKEPPRKHRRKTADILTVSAPVENTIGCSGKSQAEGGSEPNPLVVTLCSDKTGRLRKNRASFGEKEPPRKHRRKTADILTTPAPVEKTIGEEKSRKSQAEEGGSGPLPRKRGRPGKLSLPVSEPSSSEKKPKATRWLLRSGGKKL